MENALTQLRTLLTTYLPTLLGALAILIGGWLVARLIAAGVRRALKRTQLDEKLMRALGQEQESGKSGPFIAKVVFYLIMIFVLIAFFQALGLTLITEPLNTLLNRFFEFAPQLLGAAALTLAAWAIATILKKLTARVLTSTKIDERVGEKAEEGTSSVALSQTLSETVYYLVFLFFLPAILGALKLDGLLGPVQSMIDKVLVFLPNILLAAVLLVVGWFVARIVQKIVAGFLAAIGTDRLSERAGLNSVLGDLQLSGVLGYVAYVLILIPVAISALNTLKLDAITGPASDMLSSILNAIPLIFQAVLLVGIAYVVGRLLANLVSNLLKGLGFDNLITKMGLYKGKPDSKTTPSNIVGIVLLASLVLFALTEAFSVLGLAALTEISSELIDFGSRILLGLIVFGVGLYLANLAAQAVKSSGTEQAGILAMAARLAILVLFGAMGLRQMGIANEIINLAFGLLLGAVAVAAAIAFGIGGREMAARKLNEWTESVR